MSTFDYANPLDWEMGETLPLDLEIIGTFLKGEPGESAYNLAVDLGYEGSEAEWLEFLRGKSAYETAVKLGFVGDEAAWIEYLREPQADVAAQAIQALADATDAKNAAVTARNQAEGFKTTAGNSATTATTQANRAEAEADAALAAQAAASASKTAAEAAKDAAEASKTAAKTSETSAASSAATAGTRATAASNSAAAALASKTEAATSATNAANNATAANTSKNQAATSATNAATSATSAANSATTANNSKNAAATSATNAAASEAQATAKALEAVTAQLAAADSAVDSATSASAADAARIAAEAARDEAQDIAGGSVPWDDVTGKPADYPPSDHDHTFAQISGTKTQLSAAVTDGDPLYVGDIKFGATDATGVNDFNDARNIVPGFAPPLLLQSTAANAPAIGNYYHVQNVHYGTSGNITQFALPYGHPASLAGGIHFRGRFSNAWSEWYKIFSTATPPAVADVTGLSAELTGKANATHQHVPADIVVSASGSVIIGRQTTTGAIGTITISTAPTANSVPIRGTNGVLQTGEPTADNHAVTRKYVNDALALKINKATDTVDGAFNVLGYLTAGTGDDTVHIRPSTIEIGKMGGRSAAGNAILDFHSSVNNNDYDARIIVTGGTAAAGGGSMTFNGASYWFNGPVVLNLGDPTNDNHAARKKYVDDKIASSISALVGSAPAALDTFYEIAQYVTDQGDVVDGLVLSIAGKANSSHTHAPVDIVVPTGIAFVVGRSAVNGPTEAVRMSVGISANSVVQRDGTGRTQVLSPSVANDAANKQYVDAQRDTRLNKAGDSFTGGFARAEAANALSGISITPDYTASNWFTYSNTAAFTLNAPASNNPCNIMIEIINGSGAGALAAAGFNYSDTSAMDTTANARFIATIVVFGSGKKYLYVAKAS